MMRVSVGALLHSLCSRGTGIATVQSVGFVRTKGGVAIVFQLSLDVSRTAINTGEGRRRQQRTSVCFREDVPYNVRDFYF